MSREVHFLSGAINPIVINSKLVNVGGDYNVGTHHHHHLRASTSQHDVNVQRSLETIKDTQLADKIERWLFAPDSSRNYNEARKKYQKDTFSWFLDGERFREWEQKADFLWIKGTSGCGKTILISSIIKKVIELRKVKKSIYVTYFFFDGRDSQTDLQQHDKLIRSLIWQLSLQCDGIPTDLVQLYDGLHHQQPSTSESLEDTLHRIIAGLDSVYVVVDSLDECTDRSETLQWIQNIIAHSTGNLHLLVASRPERDITDALQPLDLDCVDLAREVAQDITLYIDEQLALPALNRWDDETRDIARSTLAKGADGMFRWVALQFMELMKCPNKHSVMKRLNSLPKGLYGTYDRMLMKIDDDDQGDTKAILQWLCFSVRPLTLAEMAEALAIDFDAENGPQYLPSRQYWDERHALDKCSGLISESEGSIKLAHLSIKEYLLSEHIRTQSIATFHLTEELSDAFISQSCLAYLLHFDGFIDQNRMESLALAPYAARHWIFHAKSGGIDDSEESVTLKLAQRLFTERRGFLNWIWLWNDNEPYRDMRSINDADLPAPLDYASRAGLQRLSQQLLLNGADVNAQGGIYGNALQAASLEGHETVVKLLVENGADVNAQGGVYGNALQAASIWGYKEIVELLLENGANVNANGGSYENALQAASIRGHDAVVKLLLENGADVNAKGGFYRNALQAASLEGHETIVKLLLENGADVNTTGGSHENDLYAASGQGRKEIVKLLLENGADVNAKGGFYRNALLAASVQGHKEVVKLLLENGADVNAAGGGYENALQAASHEGHETIVKLLLENGADVNAKGGEYGNALQAASIWGHDAVVKLLLEIGADSNTLR